jgi:hypothetical protein
MPQCAAAALSPLIVSYSIALTSWFTIFWGVAQPSTSVYLPHFQIHSLHNSNKSPNSWMKLHTTQKKMKTPGRPTNRL